MQEHCANRMGCWPRPTARLLLSHRRREPYRMLIGKATFKLPSGGMRREMSTMDIKVKTEIKTKESLHILQKLDTAASVTEVETNTHMKVFED